MLLVAFLAIPFMGNATETVNSTDEYGQPIIRHVLDNGFTILIKPTNNHQRVVSELYIHAGSKDEKTGEKGIAHLIEHMLFKGTNNLVSETDLFALSSKLGGYANAHTSYDYTSVELHLPTHYWQYAIPVLADVMQNCSFNVEHLNSELPTVVQELHLNRDNHYRTLFWHEMLAAIIADHPYHYPIIGHAHDLWNVDIETLKQFYTKHYVPENCCLMVVGKIDPISVIEIATQYFAPMPRTGYKKARFFHAQDLSQKNVTIYRNVATPKVGMVYVLPGSARLDHDAAQALVDVLSKGKNGRLNKIRDELHLAENVQADLAVLEDLSFLFFAFEPNQGVAASAVTDAIQAELDRLSTEGASAEDLEALWTQSESSRHYNYEHNTKQAELLIFGFLEFGDETRWFKSRQKNIPLLNDGVKNLTTSYCRKSMAHTGSVLPIADEDKPRWELIEQEINASDERITAGKQRTLAVEGERYSTTVSVDAQQSGPYPKPQSFKLPNGITVFAHHDPNILFCDIDIGVSAVNYAAIPAAKIALLNVLVNELGTKRRSLKEFQRFFELIGAESQRNQYSFTCRCQNKDVPAVFEELNDLLTGMIFDDEALTRAIATYAQGISNFWDDANSINDLIQREVVLGVNEIYSSPYMMQDLATVTASDMEHTFHQIFAPTQMTLYISGNLANLDLTGLAGTWFGSLADRAMPAERVMRTSTRGATAGIISHHLNNAQVSMSWSCPSISKTDPDYLPVILYMMHFNNRIFNLREKYGMFYTISGNMLADATDEPGYATIKTITSPHNMEFVKVIVADFIKHDIERFTEIDRENAIAALSLTFDQWYATNQGAKDTFKVLNYYNHPFNYYETLPQQLAQITLAEIKAAVKKYLDLNKMQLTLVGPVGSEAQCTYESLGLGNLYDAVPGNHLMTPVK